MAAFDLAETYLQLLDGPGALTMKGGAEFWSTLDERPERHEGRLVAIFPNERDWAHWEMHPEGDEVIVQLSGSCDFILDEPAAQRVVPLRGRATCIVPQGIWHRAIVHEPGEILAITRGKGTRHRPL